MIQTEIDSNIYNKMIKNHNLINFQRSLVRKHSYFLDILSNFYYLYNLYLKFY